MRHDRRIRIRIRTSYLVLVDPDPKHCKKRRERSYWYRFFPVQGLSFFTSIVSTGKRIRIFFGTYFYNTSFLRKFSVHLPEQLLSCKSERCGTHRVQMYRTVVPYFPMLFPFPKENERYLWQDSFLATMQLIC